MTLVFVLLGLSIMLELLAPLIGRQYDLARLLCVSTAAGLLCAVIYFLLITDFSLFTAGIVLAAVYRFVHQLRILKGRMHPDYLRRVSVATTCWLGGVQAGLYLIGTVWHDWSVPVGTVWLGLALLQCTVGWILLRTVRRHVRHAAAPSLSKSYSQNQLPTVTVAIAARNETDSLMSCLQSVIASDYPKLEILVLDDCSQERRTAEIIRSFAHAGVRFVPGTEPKDNWLARNQAYDTLAAQANGEFIVFCSTSVRLQPDSIKKLSVYALARKKAMISVLPRIAGRPGSSRDDLYAYLRAAWELLLPRRQLRQPPVISSLWMVRRTSLKKSGGFAAVSRMVKPEAYFARTMTAHDGYSFLPGGDYFGVTSQDGDEQERTKFIRTAYPALRRRPELVGLAAVGFLVFGLLPFIQVAAAMALLPSSLLTGVLSLVCCGLLLAAYRSILLLAHGPASLRQVAAFPAAVLAAITMYHYSMYKYEFSEVVWKERNICVPVMHAIPHLPAA